MQENNTNEIWKDIPNYENKYQISSYGRIKALKRLIWNGKGYYTKPEQILKPYDTKRGYKHIDLCGKTHKVHRLVACSFLEQQEGKTQVNHKNGNKTDNRVENLEWCDNSENQLHAYKNGLKKCSILAGRKPLRIESFNLVTGNTVKQYSSVSEAKEELGIKHQNMLAVCRGKRNSCLGFGWRFVNG